MLLIILMEIIEEYLKDPYDFLENANIKTLVSIAKTANEAYRNKEKTLMTDDEYDLIIDRIKFINPDHSFFKKVGAKVDSKIDKVKVTLPFFMGSMDKIRPENNDKLEKFKKDFGGPYIVSDKLDGVSALLIINENEKKLYTRGNGFIGTDITNLLELINIDISNIKTSVIIRGELIISKTNFKKYEKTMANARNMVSGIVNSKTVDVNAAKDIDFVAYEIVEPWMTFYEQFKHLEKYKIKTVYHVKVKNIDMIFLENILKERKESSEYECDGIIFVHNSPNIRSHGVNPEYALAFKNLAESETAIVKVIKVEWHISKHGYIKPRLLLESTKLSGVTIKHVTAFNAKFIKDNIIGPGSEIKLVRSGDVIPHILEVTKKSKNAQMPDYNYSWNESGVDIIATNKSDEQLIKELTNFCQKLDIKNISEGIITKFVEAGIDSIDKILNVKKEDLQNVENFKDKMVQKIFLHISERIKTITLLDLMVASNKFGHGLGERKIKKILDIHPDIIYLYIEMPAKKLIDLIIDIEGFDMITAKKFVSNMPHFLELLNQIPENIQEQILLELPTDNIVSNKMDGFKIVFSGFRNKDWEKHIIENGGSIITAVSKNTTLLVSTQSDIEENTNSKIKTAIKLNILVLNKEDFYDKYIV